MPRTLPRSSGLTGDLAFDARKPQGTFPNAGPPRRSGPTASCERTRLAASALANVSRWEVGRCVTVPPHKRIPSARDREAVAPPTSRHGCNPRHPRRMRYDTLSSQHAVVAIEDGTSCFCVLAVDHLDDTGRLRIQVLLRLALGRWSDPPAIQEKPDSREEHRNEECDGKPPRDACHDAHSRRGAALCPLGPCYSGGTVSNRQGTFPNAGGSQAPSPFARPRPPSRSPEIGHTVVHACSGSGDRGASQLC